MTTTTKKRLFAIGAEALAQIRPQVTGLYACPICSLLLPAEAVDNGDLTLEHVPQESVGGKGITLTCRRCNSTAGHTIDAALHGRERFLELGRAVSGRGGQFEGPVKVTIEGVTTNARLVFRDGKFMIEVREKVNNPTHFKRQIETLKERQQRNSGEAKNFNLDAKVKFNFDRARIADLRAAFLAAFAKFGYRYAYHPRLVPIRKQILRPDETLIDGAWWIANPVFTEDPMMIMITSPLTAVMVRLRSVLVFLPWLEGQDDFYPAIRKHFASHPAQLTYNVLEWPTTMIMLLDLRGRPAAPDGN